MVINSLNKVVKFGGSSLASAQQFQKVKDIINADPSRKFVVPSAPGKRFGNDTKVTDMLIECHDTMLRGDDFKPLLNKIYDRYNEIAVDLKLDTNLKKEFEIIENNLNNKCNLDYMASRGEYLNGLLLSEYIGFDFIDAAEIIFFNEKGMFDAERTNKKTAEKLSGIKTAVIPGFYGTMPDGSVKTFSRGGSDITGAIISRAIMSDVYENWTDVSGVLMCDPRIIDSPKTIKKITYRELRELSYMGFTVLHEDSIFPVKQVGIPINIKNTNKPDDEGTFIMANAKPGNGGSIITGIAGKKGFSILHIEKDMMNQEIGFGMKVLKVIYDLGMSFEHFPSGIDTMSVILNEACVDGREKELIAKISEAVEPDNVHIEKGLSLVAVVGRGMINSPGTASRIFSAVAREGINIRMIDQGSSELNIIIGVEESDFEKAIKAIYSEFC